MKKEDLIDAIGRIDGKYVMEAEYTGKIKTGSIMNFSRYQAWISLAACLCILVLAGYIGGNYLLRVDKGKSMEESMDMSAAITTEEAADEAMPESTTEGTEEDSMEASTESSTEDTVDESVIRDESANKENMESAETESAKEDMQLTSPPVLTAIYAEDKTQLSIHSGTSSWSYQSGEDWNTVETDSLHPVEQQYDDTNTIYLVNNADNDTNVIELQFEVIPDRLEILNCWKEGTKVNENMAANVSDKSNILVPFTDGNYIYEIVAYWDHADYRGTAYYSLKTVVNK